MLHKRFNSGYLFIQQKRPALDVVPVVKIAERPIGTGFNCRYNPEDRLR
jgi:hypothetical protein